MPKSIALNALEYVKQKSQSYFVENPNWLTNSFIIIFKFDYI